MPPTPVALSPLPSGGQTWHLSPPSGAGAVSGRVGKPATQGGQSLNRLDWAVTSPPPPQKLGLSPGPQSRGGSLTGQTILLHCGWNGAYGKWGAGGGGGARALGVQGGRRSSGSVSQARPSWGSFLGEGEEAAGARDSLSVARSSTPTALNKQ